MNSHVRNIQITTPTTGLAIVHLMRDLVNALERAHESGGMSSAALAAHSGAMAVAKASSTMRVQSDVEALAQACLLAGEAENLTAEVEDMDHDVRATVQRLQVRSMHLAAWIESHFGIDRKDYRLDFFADKEMGERNLMPHLVGAVA